MTSFYFLDRSKHRNILWTKNKGCSKAGAKNRSIGKLPEGKTWKRRRNIENLTCPHVQPDQSKKLFKGKDLHFIDNLVQDLRLYTNENFILWIKSSSVPKTILFLSFQIVQKRHMGVTFQIFSCFLRIKALYQLRLSL